MSLSDVCGSPLRGAGAISAMLARNKSARFSSDVCVQASFDGQPLVLYNLHEELDQG